jgi:hypothetical protein
MMKRTSFSKNIINSDSNMLGKFNIFEKPQNNNNIIIIRENNQN